MVSIFTPLYVIIPFDGLYSPISNDIKVVFPAPFCPTMDIFSPKRIFKVKFFNAYSVCPGYSNTPSPCGKELTPLLSEGNVKKA